MLALLDLDPNIVKPGWTPLLITVAMGAVMVLLFISLRRQFRKIDKNFPMPEAPQSAGTPAASTPAATSSAAGTEATGPKA
ncbi:hypothetical protein SAMN05421756_107113 [Microlunatus flavus]|uniref:Uncharacterized protein n=1 Tax=Microlunatus flavus TaxID=1036181 RepID=A0A1H9K911_9ACTN|nr:hypothetical protein SAMN05421756_107113 [Microlunatus flavus]